MKVDGIEWCAKHQGVVDECGSQADRCDMHDATKCDQCSCHYMYVNPETGEWAECEQCLCEPAQVYTVAFTLSSDELAAIRLRWEYNRPVTQADLLTLGHDLFSLLHMCESVHG